jgi:poly(A) polymerase
MLRTLRFAAKLGFSVEAGSAAPFDELAPLLDDIPAARLYDEFGKLFLTGNAQATLQHLRDYRVFEHLFPGAARLCGEDAFYSRLLDSAMQNTDTRIREDKPVTPAFILAAILWPEVCERRQALERQGENPVPAMHGAGQEIVAQACQRIAIPRRFSMPMREIWELQLRLERPTGKRAIELMSKRRFRAAYDFLLLREQAGEDCGGLGAVWTQMQEEHGPIVVTERESDEQRPTGRRRRRGGRRRQAPAP